MKSGVPISAICKLLDQRNLTSHILVHPTETFLSVRPVRAPVAFLCLRDTLLLGVQVVVHIQLRMLSDLRAHRHEPILPDRRLTDRDALFLNNRRPQLINRVKPGGERVGFPTRKLAVLDEIIAKMNCWPTIEL